MGLLLLQLLWSLMLSNNDEEEETPGQRDRGSGF